MNEELRKALTDLDLARAEELLRAGADINVRNECGESLLDDLMFDFPDASQRLTFVKFMLDHGADPLMVSKEGSGPLFAALLCEDTEVLRVLLDHGADPNLENDAGEPLYDYAEFDYRDEAYRLDLPERPTDADKASEEAWLLFLDRIAVKYGKRPPDYLFLLRERGALTYGEQQRRKAGNP